MAIPTKKQDFFRTSLAEDVNYVGAGTIKVNQLPTETAGRLVVSATNATKREIIRYTSIDAAAGGVVVADDADRGLGGTRAQTHKQNEPVQMNITAEDYNDLVDAIGAKAERLDELQDVDGTAKEDGRLVQWNETTGQHEYVDPPTLGETGIATEQEAIDGENNTKMVTPLRAKQARDAALANLKLKDHGDVDSGLTPSEQDMLVYLQDTWQAKAPTDALPSVVQPVTYTPAYLTGGSGAQSNFALWNDIADGSFRISIDGTTYNVDAIDLTTAAAMADVATLLQAALRTATNGEETVVWDTDHFVVRSADTTDTSAISVTETSTGTVGTDISGTSWMDCVAGTVTDKVLDQTADSGKYVRTKTNGRIDPQVLPEGLAGGGNADASHGHARIVDMATAGEALTPGDLCYVGTREYYSALTDVTEASYVNQSSSTSNYGSVNELQMSNRSSNEMWAYIKLPTSIMTAPTGHTMGRAIKLRIYQSSSRPRSGNKAQLGIYAATSTWDENSITWNNKPSVQDVGVVTPVFDSQKNVWHEIEFAVTASQWANISQYGLVLKQMYRSNSHEYADATIRSDDYTSPQIAVSYVDDTVRAWKASADRNYTSTNLINRAHAVCESTLATGEAGSFLLRGMTDSVTAAEGVQYYLATTSGQLTDTPHTSYPMQRVGMGMNGRFFFDPKGREYYVPQLYAYYTSPYQTFTSWWPIFLGFVPRRAEVDYSMNIYGTNQTYYWLGDGVLRRASYMTQAWYKYLRLRSSGSSDSNSAAMTTSSSFTVHGGGSSSNFSVGIQGKNDLPTMLYAQINCTHNYTGGGNSMYFNLYVTE